MTRLSRITIYPIKSLPGLDLDQCEARTAGCLADDRRYALVDAEGRFVNGKRTAEIHRVRAKWSDAGQRVALSLDGGPAEEFAELLGDAGPGQWLSDALGAECRVVENPTHGFPDDTDAPGPTLVSTATLREVARWFPGIDLDEARRRFRTNLELDADEPWWEDRLVSDDEWPQPFSLGELSWIATGVCQRCVVPTRDALSGERTAGFTKQFATRREASLPDWSPRSRFDHFYRLAINTRPAPGFAGGTIRTGDLVESSG